MSLVALLKDWRDQAARREGVEPYFVLRYDTIEAIARQRPRSLEALAEIKGIGPKKIAQYGAAILAAVLGAAEPAAAREENAVLTVGEYLARLNDALAQHPARLQGEIASVNVRERVMYFAFRDPSGGGVLSCLVFASRYRMMGVKLREGLEVIISGTPSIWPRTGRLSLRVETIELVGEGKLQRAYLALQRKLETEGLFGAERKRPIPRYAERIGLITSERGEAMHDFLANLERVGLKISLLDCRVEGARAVPGLVAAIQQFNRSHDAAVLVITRGGGSSWEILQPYNNEAVCRAVVASHIPILMGVGHERDVPLAALAADRYVSTPTAAAVLLSQPWREARMLVPLARADLAQALDDQLRVSRQQLERSARTVAEASGKRLRQAHADVVLAAARIRGAFSRLTAAWPNMAERLRSGLAAMRTAIRQRRATLVQVAGSIGSACRRRIAETRRLLATADRQLAARNPSRLLELGWSLTYRSGKLVRTSRELARGDHISLRFGRGGASSTIDEISP